MTKKSSAVTIRDVAREAGVSVATVSRYINQSAPVSKDISNRIEQAIADLEYIPNVTARQLAKRETRVVGLLVRSLHNDFFGPLFSGIEAILQEHRYNFLVATHRADDQSEPIPPIGPHNTDGLIVFADSMSDDGIVNFYHKGFPQVLIHRSSPPNCQIPSVTIENKNATQAVVDHLITVHEKRKIMFIRGPASQEDSFWREVGYRQALEDHGIAFDHQLVIVSEFEREIAYREMVKFLANPHPEFDAIFTGDDDSAIGVLTALQECGYRVPEDIGIVGFDDLKLSAFLSPPLTTVRAPTELVGKTAASLLFALLEGEEVEPLTFLPTEIILRRSCGCQS